MTHAKCPVCSTVLSLYAKLCPSCGHRIAYSTLPPHEMPCRDHVVVPPPPSKSPPRIA